MLRKAVKRKDRKTKAKIDRWTVGVGVATLFVLFLQFVAFGYQGHVLKRTIATMERLGGEQLIASQRPWIYPRLSVASDLTFDEGGANITIAYDLSNAGKTPANSVDLDPRFFLHDFGEITGEYPDQTVVRMPTDAPRKLKELCQANIKVSEGADKFGWMTGDPIFPNMSLSAKFSVSIPKSEIETATRRSVHGLILPYLLINVTYRFLADTKSHYTGMIFILSRRDTTRDIRPSEGNIPATELTLISNPFRSGVAT